MRPLSLALLLLPALAGAAADDGRVPVDWTRLQPALAEEQVSGLRRLGFRLEPDGRVLDAGLRSLDRAGLERALRALRALGEDERRLRLERLRLLLDGQPADRPLSAEALSAARALASGRVAAALEQGLSASALSRLAQLDLSAAASVFDGSAGAGTVSAAGATPSRAARPFFPYLSTAEQRAGENLRAAAEAQLSRVPRGRLILSRLNGRDGRPNLPPMLVETSDAPARYDANRRALVLDRELVIAELNYGAPPRELASRRAAYDLPDGLARALADDPEAAARVIARQDVIVAHELVHAWQDRRDPLFRRMVRGELPNALVLEYEEEAFVEKNLYLHDKLAAEPGAYVDPAELADHVSMTRDYGLWREDLFDAYRTAVPNAVELGELHAMQARRINDAAAYPARTPLQAQVREARVRRLERDAAVVSQVRSEHSRRQQTNERPAAVNVHLTLARHFLALSRSSAGVEKISRLQSAEDFARLAGDTELLREIRATGEAR